ncbi:hypothetical protein AB0M12_14860 [Nocardia vinacea]|uniref:hypothetical protein n=1 Tax=Nocardia vinacea TaxID=96468 RepID=UPI00342259DC
MTSPSTEGVVDLLTAQHKQIKELFAQLKSGQGDKSPTRPHPKTGESAPANLLAGPPPAVFDRAHDAVRDWRREDDG